MTAQGEDILAWLEGAISVREAAATDAAAAYGGYWVQGFPEQHKDPDMRYGWDQDMVHLSQEDPHIAYQCLSDEIAAHTVLNDPESVLRRCAADRKLLESHQPTSGIGYEPDADSTPGAYGDIARACSSCGTPNEYAVRFPCHVVRMLAEGYGWTEGEQRRCGYTKQHPPHTFMRLEVLFQCPGAEGTECLCASGSPEMYEGPSRDCPIHGEHGTEGERS